jgi:hypothetical protein
MQSRPEEAARLEDSTNLPKTTPQITVWKGNSSDDDIEPAVMEGKVFSCRTDERHLFRQTSTKPQSVEVDIHTESALISIARDQRLTGTATDIEHATVCREGWRVDVSRIGRIGRGSELHQVIGVGHASRVVKVTVGTLYGTVTFVKLLEGKLRQ